MIKLNMTLHSMSSFFRRPLVLIVLVGLILRFVLMPLVTYDFDIYHWALIIENINSGNNLYDLAGYYYTPVWGYILGAMSALANGILSIDIMGMTFTDMLPIEDLTYRFHIGTITTIEFNLFMKVPLVICDIVVGYIIYKLVLERTGDKKKATYGFALWFLCPIIIYMSAVQAMFDTISALFLLLTVFMVYKDKCFLAGMLFSAVILLKFFPAFCILVFIGYILVKHKEDGLAKRKLFEAILGAAIMLIVLIVPQIINGQVDDALSFVIGRASNSTISSMLFTLFGTTIAILGMLYFGYRMFKTRAEDADKALFENIFLSISCAMLISITPQYVIVMIPFLILYILTTDIHYRKCWILISVGAVVGAFVLNNYSLLCSLSEYTSIVAPDWIISSMRALEGTLFGVTYMNIMNSIANMTQYIGILLILVFYFSDKIYEKCPRIGSIILRFKNMGVKKSEI